MHIVTGGAGFIGSAIVAQLNQDGADDILIVDDVGESEKWLNLRGLSFGEYLHKDTFIAMLEENSLGFTPKSIIHMGACSTTTEEDFDYLWNNNVRFSMALARYAHSNSVRFIYASSAATYGAGEEGYSDDLNLLNRLRPLNRYGYSKQLFDRWAVRTGIVRESVGLKFFNVYGPNEYHKGEQRSVVHRAFEQVQELGTIKLFKSYRPEYADGEQQRDFVYVKDCTRAVAWLLEHPEVAGIFNFGSGQARTWNDLAHAVFSALDREPQIEYIPMPDQLINQYQYFTEADMDRWRKICPDLELTSLEAGVSDYVKNYLTTLDPYLP